MSNWRTVQTFLSTRPLTVCEVEIDLDSNDIRCSCARGFRGQTCRHLRLVRARLRENHGVYPLQMHQAIDLEQFDRVFEDPTAFRSLVLEHGHVEVL